MASTLNKPLRLESFLAVVRPSLKSESIFIRLHNGNGCCVHVDPSDTLKNVFSSIQVKKLGIPSTFRVFFFSKQIKNFELTVEEIGLKSKSIVHVEPVEKDEAKKLKIDLGIYYKEEKTFVRIKTEESLLVLKKKLSKLLKISLRDMKLYFRGQELINKRTIDSYQIKNNSLLVLQSQRRIKIEPSLVPPEKEGLLDSPKMKEKRASMFQNNEALMNSPTILLCRSLRQNVKQEDLGYEIDVKEDDKKNEEAQMKHLRQYAFNFNLLQSEESPSKLIPESLLKTQLEEDQNGNERCSEDDKLKQSLSFSQRLMII